MTEGLPRLDEPLGSLDFRVRWPGPGSDAPFRVAGRRAAVAGHGTGPIETVWAGGVRVARDLRVTDGTVRSGTETPLGVERRLDVGGRPVVERVVTHRDAPVVWIEWAPGPGAAGDSADSDGLADSPGSGAGALSLEWWMGLDAPDPAAGQGGIRPGGAPRWERRERGGVATRRDPPFAAYVAFSAPPIDMAVEPVGGELRVRARLAIPVAGVRIALVGAGVHEDAERLLRMAGRTRVAVRGRAGAANRLLDDGLSIGTPDAALDDAVVRSILRLDEAGVPASPGPWRTEDAIQTARAHLMIGGFGEVRAFLERLGRLARQDRGRVPARAMAGRGLEHDDGHAGLLFLLLLGRYLAWSGDLSGVRALWPAARSVAAAAEASHAEVRADALDALRMAAEAIGEDDPAEALRGQVAGAPNRAPSRRGVTGGVGYDPSDPNAPASTIAAALGGLLQPEPYAPRGRLELRPRLPASWDRFEVRGLAVGSAAVDVLYRRDGTRHRFEASQPRGPTPLTLVLAPELTGTGAAAARVDRKPAQLDVQAAGDRRRVPIQLVLDHPRTLEVEFATESP